MKVAMGGDDSNSETDDEEQLTQRKSTSSSSGKASRQAMESARRFLWDDDEEAVDVRHSVQTCLDGKKVLILICLYNSPHKNASRIHIKLHECDL